MRIASLVVIAEAIVSGLPGTDRFVGTKAFQKCSQLLNFLSLERSFGDVGGRLIASRFQMVNEGDSSIGLVSQAHDSFGRRCFVRQLEGL